MTTSKILPEKTPLCENTGIYSKNETKQFCNGIETFCNGITKSNGDRNLRKGDTPFDGGGTATCNATAFEYRGEKFGKYLISPLGDFKNGDYIQRIDSVAAMKLKQNCNRVWSRIRNTFGNACPVYYEHPDHEDLKEIPNEPDKTPYGKVRSLEVLKDGIYANIEWLAGFGELPRHLQISPRWNADMITDKIGRPVRLVSLGLTRNPNIKDTSFVNSTTTKDTYMDKEILNLLGYSEEEAQKIIDKAEDAPADVLERLKNALKEWSASQNKIAEAQKEAENAKTALANSEASFKAEREARAKLIISNAVKSGKIIQAQAESAEQILANSADFEAEAKKLEEQEPVVKTSPETEGIEAAEKKRISDEKKAREEIAKLVEEKQEKGMPYNEAWNAVKNEKKELFEAAYPDK